MKHHYRDELLRMMNYVKITKFCSILGISQSNLSWFLKGRDERMSIYNLELLISTIKSELSTYL